MTGIVENEHGNTYHAGTYKKMVSPGVTLRLSPSGDRTKPWVLESDDWSEVISVNGRDGFLKTNVSAEDLVTVGAGHTPVDLRGMIKAYAAEREPRLGVVAVEAKEPSPRDTVSHAPVERLGKGDEARFDRGSYALATVSALLAICLFWRDYPLVLIKALVTIGALSGVWFEFIYWRSYFKGNQ